ncbi:MAG TPA: zinc ribbon domain-containing protein [Patescibacteria group bacterium]|nr:zinc ribbon domain-containing protein [Patescibacteria group bacterium]
MDKSFCPVCHTEVRLSDYFCFNCGKNLHEKPPSVTPESQAMLYLGSIFLPPMGVIWGWRYLKRDDQKSKIVGTVAMVITVIVLLLAVKWTVDIVNAVNKQMGQFNSMQGF